MKKAFIEPEVDLILLQVADVITTSGLILEEDELPLVPALPWVPPISGLE